MSEEGSEKSAHNNNANNGGLYEKEVHRLQREADTYTMEYEHEKKRHLITSDQEKQNLEILKNTNDRIKIKQPDPEIVYREKIKRDMLSARLANKKVLHNKTMGVVRGLHVNIDILRREIGFSHKSISALQEEIGALKSQSLADAKVSIHQAGNADQTNNQILACKARSEVQNQEFKTHFQALQGQLNAREPNKKGDDEEANNEDDGLTQKDATFANPIEITKRKQSRGYERLCEKQRLFDQYHRNASIVEEAFNVIRKNSGITNLDEIVTTFLKAEEQNYSLYRYVDDLGQENDVLVTQNAHLDKEIERYEEVKRLSKTQQKTRVQEMREYRNALKSNINGSIRQMADARGEFKGIQDMVEDMVHKFKVARFETQISRGMVYDDQTVFNESNIQTYLSELEELVNRLITQVAAIRGDPNAPISAMNMNSMNLKDFNKKPMRVDVPMDSGMMSMGGKSDMDTAEDNIEVEIMQDGKKCYEFFAETFKSRQVQNEVSHAQQKGSPRRSTINNNDIITVEAQEELQ